MIMTILRARDVAGAIPAHSEAERRAAVQRALALWNDAQGDDGQEQLARLSSSARRAGVRPQDILASLQAERDDTPIVLQE